jgi:hypothetical protein
MKNLIKKIALFILLAIFFFPSISFAELKIATDPSRIGVGARILGLGGAYLGLADDLSGIFINPAALSSVSNWQATSLTGRFINEYDYLNFGAALPTDYGVFGIGYAGSGISFFNDTATTESVGGIIRIIPSTTEGVSYEFNNPVLLLSWGRGFTGAMEKLSVGATLKTFFLDISGPGTSNSDAFGNELDLGLHYAFTPAVKAGLVLENTLPASMGGKIKWSATDAEETFPLNLKTGISVRPIGRKGWRRLGDHELTLNLDHSFYPNKSDLPSLLHFGVEWSPIEHIDLRTGFDQNVEGIGNSLKFEPTGNFTAGVGIYFNKFRFDYAFHKYNELSDNDTHYFSLSYGIFKKKPGIKPAFLISPADKTILYTEKVLVKGEVRDKEINRVTVNNVEVQLKDYTFEIEVPLALRKNSIYVRGYRGEKLIDTERIRILRLKGFKDVAIDHWASLPISFLAMEEVVVGYPDETYKPEGNITRAEMSTLLMRTWGQKEEVIETGFTDVAKTHWAAGFIARAAKDKVFKGYPDGTFQPKGLITRTEGVLVIARFAKIPEVPMPAAPFSDVPVSHWAAKEITAAKEAGILKYLEGKPFMLKKKLDRAESAEILSKTKYYAQRLADLLDWEKGYE